MVSVGATVEVPLRGSTRPMPVMSTVSAFCTCQDKTLVCPAVMVCGFAVTKDRELAKRIGFIQNGFGAILGY